MKWEINLVKAVNLKVIKRESENYLLRNQDFSDSKIGSNITADPMIDMSNDNSANYTCKYYLSLE